MLLQDATRLSGAAYTVGGGRRAGGDTRPYTRIKIVCVGADVLIGPRAATWGRPYEIPYPFRGASLWGNSKSRGGRRPPPKP